MGPFERRRIVAVATAALLCATCLTLLWLIGGGFAGLLYGAGYALACAAGLPLGFALFGRHHAAGWIGGALIGYGVTAFGWGLAIQAGLTHPAAFLAVWALPAALMLRRRTGGAPLIALPEWTPGATQALLLTLLLVPAIAGPPFLRVGRRDAAGRRSYRAYFTADYLWHAALTAELTRFNSSPRNPYLATEPLHYYWTYFNVPAVMTAMRAKPDAVEPHLKANALCSGLLFISALFLAAWCAVPRAGAVALGMLVTVTSASAEGLYGIWTLKIRGDPLANLRLLNIDALTAWFLRSLTIDGLPRALWYTPQHAFACAVALVALIIASAPGSHRPRIAAFTAGLALALSLVCSPFLGGALSLVYGATAAWRALRAPHPVRSLTAAAFAAIPVMAAFGWCVASGTFEGAGGAVEFGLSRRAAAAPVRTLVFALGPVLLAATAGLLAGARAGYRWQAAVVSLLFGLGLFFFVTLASEPVWIGWRAGQIILVTIPALVAACFAWLADRARGQWLVAAAAAVLLAAGLPTTLIDLHNAGDITNTAMGPGFRWTVVVPHDTEAATGWLRANTPRDAVVQMSVGPRGRETWTLIPAFAQRRMAAGQPISLLHMPAYDEAARQADAIFSSPDPADASRLAHALHVDYIYIDEVERRAFNREALVKFEDSRYFVPVFWKGHAEVLKVK